MSRQIRFPLVAMSILLASSMLASCSGSNSGASTSNAAAQPPKTAIASVAATASSPATPAPVAYKPEPAVGVITTCNIEEFDKSSFQSTPSEAVLSATHSISGWIAAPQLAAPSFWLRLEDKAREHYFQVQVTPAVRRPDVVASVSAPSLPEKSGFILELPANTIPAGSYHLYLVAQASGKPSICDNGRQVNFK